MLLSILSACRMSKRARAIVAIVGTLGASLAVAVASTAPAVADYTASNLPNWAIGPFSRASQNPIMTPEGTGWEAADVLNPGVVYRNGAFQMLYRGQNSSGVSQVGYASSTDGINFTRSSANPVIPNSVLPYESGGVMDPRLYELNGTYYAFVAGYDWSNSPPQTIMETTSTDLVHWTTAVPVVSSNYDPAVVTDANDTPVKINGEYVMYYGDSDPAKGRYVEYSNDMLRWTGNTALNMNFPNDYDPWEICVAVTGYQTVQNGPVNNNILLFVAGTLMAHGRWYCGISEVEFSGTNLTQQLGQLTDAALSPSTPYELTGQTANTMFMNSILFHNGQWYMYYGAADHVIALATAPLRSASQPAFTSTSFETGQRLPDWVDAVDNGGGQSGGSANIGAFPGTGQSGPDDEVRLATGTYSFIADNSGLCIDTPASSTSSGTQIQQYTCNGTGAQQFTLNPSPFAGVVDNSAWYEIVNKNSGLCEGTAGGGTSTGTAVEQLSCNGSASELWKFVPTSVSGNYEVLNQAGQAGSEAWAVTGGPGATASQDKIEILAYGGTSQTNELFSVQADGGIAHTGTSSLMYEGEATGAASDYAYMQVFDLSAVPQVVGPSTTITYWILPQSSALSGVTGDNSSCVALDIIFTDGTALRNLGAVDQNGNKLHPSSQCGHLTLDQWGYVSSDIGAVAAGKTIARIDLGYDQPDGSGGYHGYIDDISLTSTTTTTTTAPTTTTQPPSEGPFGGTPVAVPGTLEAANYDTGAQGVAYNVTSVNGSANSYRSDGVDLEVTGDTSGTTGTGAGYDLGWTGSGQWFKYTVDVASAGPYTLTLRLAAPNAVTEGLHIANASGANLSGNVNVPATGAWQAYTNVTVTLSLPAGTQTLTVDQDNGGWNLHYMSFAGAGLNTSAWYEVVNQDSGLCASAAGGSTANGTAVQQLACTGATSQLWQFVATSVSGYYEVLNDNARAQGESWNITGGVGATASGDLLQTWIYSGVGNTNALFAVDAASSSGYYNFVVDNDGLCIDTPGASTASGVQLQQYACNGAPAQAFSLVQKA